jgi:hypothetical protein
VRRKRLQVGGHTRAARRIESGNGQKNWGSVVQMTIQSQCPPREAQKPAAQFCGRTGKEKCTRIAAPRARVNFTCASFESLETKREAQR